MFITMHCGGMPFNGDTIKHASLGGSETAAYYMAKELASQGHKVTLFTNSTEEGIFDGVRYMFSGNLSEQYPLGDRFQPYAERTPVDVLIIQRALNAYLGNFAAKVKLLWVHDMASKQHKDMMQRVMLNVDGILTVSQYHKDQIVKAWGINSDAVYPITNGVDLTLFKGDINKRLCKNLATKKEKEEKTVVTNPACDTQVKLLYTSRPERGLDWLVMHGGIMDQLKTLRPDMHLYVCGYDNTTDQMRDYYKALFDRCEELPNVTVLGHLNKKELADVMRQCHALVYPTPSHVAPEFREVSCITAMECMASGLPMITSNTGALPETCKGSGSILIDLNEQGLPDIKAFVDELSSMESVELTDKDKQEAPNLKILNVRLNHWNTYNKLVKCQKESAKQYDWPVAARKLNAAIEDTFNKASDTAKLKELIYNSDIVAAFKFVEHIKSKRLLNTIEQQCVNELNMCYKFYLNDTFEEHYKSYYKYEENRGANYGPEDLSDNIRFRVVADKIGSFGKGAQIMDYGCAHGHYTINLAKAFPDKNFIGVDITASNIAIARKWAKDEGLNNVTFYHGRVDNDTLQIVNFEPTDYTDAFDNYVDHSLVDFLSNGFDGVIAAEVLEHVAEPVKTVDVLRRYLVESGKMIITTPYGGWEAIGYEEHHPWRAHLWHFERADLHDIWGSFEGFDILCAPSGTDKNGLVVGSYITEFKASKDDKAGSIDYVRKFNTMSPLQTVSLCMIVKDAEDTLKRSLDNIKGIVDEVNIYVDKNTTDRTIEVINNFKQDIKLWPVVNVYTDAESPLDIGFDEARNKSIEHASGDWIAWLDADEIVNYSERMRRYLKNNQYTGYAIKQHHVSAEPAGILKTDMPVRFFRNGEGIKFFGVVHEHPEKELNAGVGQALIINDVDIMHHGYTNEEIRRKRFHRNISLMARDREKFPERILGKFLWMRDISQMTRFELEKGLSINDDMVERCKEGIRMFEELLDDKQTRMLIDGISWYGTCAGVLGANYQVAFSVDAASVHEEYKEQDKIINAIFLTKDHAKQLFNLLLDQKVANYE